jgi:type II secretory pathway predicted ATPase ExeA
VRPVLLIDEAQEMSPTVLGELRILASARFDSRTILTVVFAGDARLTTMLRSEELLPLGSRIRTRLAMEPATGAEMLDCLKHLLSEAGNAKLMTAELMATLSEHALGNYRVLAQMAADLLVAGARAERTQLDEKLYFEVFAGQGKRPSPSKTPPRDDPKRRR